MHIHVRDPKTTLPSMEGDLYAEVVDRIRASGTDVVINLTTGPGGALPARPDDPMKPGPGTTLRRRGSACSTCSIFARKSARSTWAA